MMDFACLGSTIPTELGLMTNLSKCNILIEIECLLRCLCAFVMKYLNVIQSHLGLTSLFDFDFATITFLIIPQGLFGCKGIILLEVFQQSSAQ